MIKLYVFYGGDIICKDKSQLNKGVDLKGEIALANPVFLIEHPKGRLVWDSGLSDQLVAKQEGAEAWIFHLSMKKGLLSQFEEIGLHPNDIDYFALSHIHNDHTGNANYFTSATLIMQQKEYEIAFNTVKKPFNYNDYKELKGSKVKKLNGDHDMFEDGSVQFIATPGHTPGHQSLLLKLENSGTIIISGDISYYKENYEQQGIPTFNADEEESRASILKIKQLVADNNAQLWIQHDKNLFNSLKTSPEFYS